MEQKNTFHTPLRYSWHYLNKFIKNHMQENVKEILRKDLLASLHNSEVLFSSIQRWTDQNTSLTPLIPAVKRVQIFFWNVDKIYDEPSRAVSKFGGKTRILLEERIPLRSNGVLCSEKTKAIGDLCSCWAVRINKELRNWSEKEESRRGNTTGWATIS